ncbi:MAG: hypothetical protein ACXAEL_14010 [Candidatus Hodarchaeales archaeon]
MRTFLILKKENLRSIPEALVSYFLKNYTKPGDTMCVHRFLPLLAGGGWAHRGATHEPAM